MVLQVFSIFDVVAKVYSQPFYLPTKGQAMRSFGDEVSNPQSSINKHPADYKLYKLCEFDDNSGLFKSSNPEFICNALDFVQAKKEV